MAYDKVKNSAGAAVRPSAVGRDDENMSGACMLGGRD
jgi:hypothetical protein